jgi:hypothetical protein
VRRGLGNGSATMRVRTWRRAVLSGSRGCTQNDEQVIVQVTDTDGGTGTGRPQPDPTSQAAARRGRGSVEEAQPGRTASTSSMKRARSVVGSQAISKELRARVRTSAMLNGVSWCTRRKQSAR